MKVDMNIVNRIKRTVKKIIGSIYSDVIYKYEPIENNKYTWEHTNFVIRFIYSSNNLFEELIEFLITSTKLNKDITKYKDEYHLVIGGEIQDFIQLIKNTSNTNNRFFKETIELLYYFDKSNFNEFINNNIMDEKKFIEFPNNPVFKPLEILGVQIDDIEYIYKKLNGLFTYRQLLNLAIMSHFDYDDYEPIIYNLNEFIQFYMNCNSNLPIKNICEYLVSIIGNLEQYTINNYLVEEKDETNYIIDEAIGEIVEEEFKIEEDEEGNLKYNEKNFL